MNKPTPKTYRTTNWSSYNRASLIGATFPFGLIQTLSGMHNHKTSKVEIKLTPIRLFNAV
ncbi:iS5 family transposase [Acinetobacter baumannii 21072]|uniref:IS5 family transposase n=1 Tax=Acinetobacter baumannii 21072 TaxID=1310697 RepID=A0A062IBC6_ACIBA|nr:iS5 family transposase [Acinetobacter baumannii 21072]